MSSVTGIKLYDYQGAYRYAKKLDLNTSLNLPETDYSAAYRLGQLTPDELASFVQKTYALGQQNQLQQSTQANAEKTAGFGVSELTNTSSQLSQAGVEKPYQDYVNALTYSDQNFNALMQRDQFNLYNGQMGLNIQTDGNGGVDSVSLLSSNRDIRNGTPANADTFPNRAEITERAAAISANDLSKPTPLGLRDNLAFAPPLNPENGLARQSNLNPTGVFTKINGLPFTSTLPGVNTRPTNKTPGLDNDNLLRTLQRLQPPEIDKSVIGIDARISPQEARNLGTVKASFEVNYSDSLRDNLRSLRNGLAQQAQSSEPHRIMEARKNSMPVVPYVPSDNLPTQNIFLTGNPSSQLETSADAADKKSSGGYIPFRQGASNGGTSSQQQQPQRQHKKLSAIA